MKFIRKGATPAALSRFERENAKTPHLKRFDSLTPEVKRALQGRMLKEQGRLCGYTMRRIGDSDANGELDCHIEHVQPQHNNANRELDFRNMLLCAPGRTQEHCAWGAKHKDGAEVSEVNFVSPLRPDCEIRFHYLVDGSVRPTSPGDAAAERTIELLNLNHYELTQLRRSTLKSLGLGDRPRKPINQAAAQRLSETIMKPNASGALEPFCIAIRQAAGRYADKAAKRAARLKHER